MALRKRGPDGIYHAIVWVPHLRKHVSESTKTDNFKKARDYEDKMRVRLRGASDPDEVLWAAFKAQLIQHYKTQQKADSTRDNDEDILQRFEDDTNIRRVADLTPRLLDSWKAILASANFKPASINRYLAPLKSAITLAKDWGYLGDDFSRRVKNVRVVEKADRFYYYTADQIKAIRNAAASDLERILLDVLFYTGMRRGEVYNLRWSDVDFEKNIVHVRPKGEWTPKSKKARWIPLNENLKKALLRWRRKNRKDYVVRGKKAGSGNKWYLSTMFERILNRANKEIEREEQKLQGSIHTCRHTWITHMLLAGEDIVRVKEWAGHADIKTTIRIYTHIHPESGSGKINALPY